jgi:hypothetical protein
MNGFGRDVRVRVLSSAVLFLALALPCAAQAGPGCADVARDQARWLNETVTFHGAIDHVAVIMGLITLRLKCVTAAGDTVPDGEFAFVRTLYRPPVSLDGPATGAPVTRVVRVTGVVREPEFYQLFPVPVDGPDERFRGPWLDQVQIMTCPTLPCVAEPPAVATIEPSVRIPARAPALSERLTR